MSRIPRRAAVSTLGILTMLGLAACNKAADTAADSAAMAEPVMAPAPAPVAGAPTDAQIAHIVVTANAIDSAAGAVAAEKGQSQAVKDFAKMMVTDHGGVNAQAVALATKLGVTPEDNDTSRQLSAGAEESAATLQGLTGAAFDSAYMAREVAFHQAVLDALDSTLVPNAQNAELKALMESARPAFVAHLEKAKSILGSL